MRPPIIVIGGGGHAKVLIDALRLQSPNLLGYTDPALSMQDYQGVCHLGDDHIIEKYLPSEILLVNAIGSISWTSLRRQIFEKFKKMGYSFASVIHPSSVISPGASLSEGVQVMAGAIVQTGCHVGINTIINTRVSLDHDCMVGSHVHIAPGVTLSGGVHIEDDVHIGTGTTVIQQIRIHNKSVIGAGSLVIRNVPAHRTVYGVPAKEVQP